ncbi:hypothetical protein CsatB_026531 [Cannabis sativa]|uniref:uncharacterized protein LOC115722151 n=1 Tax=Cannabis sativa TaxID=3483 RepID=UPI0011DF6524|nr:uncharacterized protein LOC115722151 [Cannabis sativa]XP_030507141.1 uncharacterized protein LOC115722151 [Cannabis sativa]XP_030507142.1 uncharacterized protein LOC115722151 [Cannabis sativa]XP_030507143.1 uncharacterized protein LOC115722151 [Cannabis sativa]
MTLSPWDLPLLADQNRYSNFESFLQSVTPIIPSKRIPKSHAEDFVECFSLNSLWKFFTERSIYGVGVPILLNNGDSVLQYYCPSLSALQIYVENPFVSPRIGGNINSWSDESENDELLSQSLSNNSSKSSDNTSDGSNTDHEVSSQQVDRFGDLYFQFNETSSPYDRVPLTEKINELAQNYPDLLKFQSTDLSPYSWIAIAWYPIYQIPLTKNVKELSACFVTYHNLSSFHGVSNTIPHEEAKTFAYRNCVVGSEGSNENLNEEEDEEEDLSAIRPFAAAMYKMNGELWMNPEAADQAKIGSYLDAATSWLKLLSFQHHDFNFFMSRRCF